MMISIKVMSWWNGPENRSLINQQAAMTCQQVSTGVFWTALCEKPTLPSLSKKQTRQWNLNYQPNDHTED